MDVLDPVILHQVPKLGVHHGAKQGKSLGRSGDLLLVRAVRQGLALMVIRVAFSSPRIIQ